MLNYIVGKWLALIMKYKFNVCLLVSQMLLSLDFFFSISLEFCFFSHTDLHLCPVCCQSVQHN